MRRDVWKRGTDWYVRLPDGVVLNVNSERAAEMLLGLLETVTDLEAQLRKRKARRDRNKPRRERGKEDGE
jgi:ribosome-associated translation inhibitor RaiA